MEDYTENQLSKNFSESLEWVEKNMTEDEMPNLEHEPIEGTPFTLIKGKMEFGEAWKIYVGVNMASYITFKSRESAIKYMNGELGIPWDLFTTLCEAVYENKSRS